MWLLVAAVAGAGLDWWTSFCARKVVTVATRESVQVESRRGYSNEYGGVEWSEYERAYFITDTAGEKLAVSKEAYDLAVVGERLALRHWVAEWRPWLQTPPGLPLLILGLCLIAVPVTGVILELNSRSASVSFSMNLPDARTALEVTGAVRDTLATGTSRREAAKLWLAAAQLCLETVNCAHVQIAGDLYHHTVLKNISLRVYDRSWKVLRTDESYRSELLLIDAMGRVSDLVHRGWPKPPE